MQTINAGYNGLSLMMMLNWDRFLYLGTVGLALLFGAWIGGL